MTGALRLFVALCTAQVLGMIGISAFAALLPAFAEEWQLSNIEAGWISGIYYAGYVVAVPLLTSLTDRVDARRIYLASTALGGVASIGFALLADGFWSALFWRTLAGVGLAGTYMPGLKALTDRVAGPILTRGLGFYTGGFSIGLSLSFLVAGAIDAWLGWRWAFGAAAIGSVLALAIAAWALKPHAPEPPAAPRPHLLDFRPVLRNRAAMGFAIAYGAHAWELFGLRSWIVAFLAFVLARQADGATTLSATMVAMLSSLVGLPASLFGNELCLRFGRRPVLIAAMLVSAVVACAIGFAGALTYAAAAALMIFYGGTRHGRFGVAHGGYGRRRRTRPARRHHGRAFQHRLSRRLRRADRVRRGARRGGRQRQRRRLGPGLRLARCRGRARAGGALAARQGLAAVIERWRLAARPSRRVLCALLRTRNGIAVQDCPHAEERSRESRLEARTPFLQVEAAGRRQPLARGWARS